MGQEFLGKGWMFPVQLDRDGEIAMSVHEKDIQESIRIILGTSPGERTMRPDFGCGMHDYVFAPNNARTAGLVRHHVEEALALWEPRIEVEEVAVSPDPSDRAVMLIEIRYRTRDTDSRFNLVYPFTLRGGRQYEQEGAGT
jgi:phage baseplate assembly protein W